MSNDNYKKEHNHWLCKSIQLHRKPQIDQHDIIMEVSEISQDKLPPKPEESIFLFHHNFYPKPKIDLIGAKISEET